MYNEKIKNEFMSFYEKKRVIKHTTLTGLFNKIEEYEKEHEKDCCFFRQEEIILMYKGFHAKSVNVLENYTVYLKAYADYCSVVGVYNNNCYMRIKKSALMECIDSKTKKQKFITREQLDEIEIELYNYTDKAIVECLWHGIGGKSMGDIVSLNREMINKDKKCICFADGRIVNITDKLYIYLDKAFKENEYRCYGITGQVKRVFGSDCLYKERDNAHALDSEDKYFRWIYRRIQNYRGHTGNPMMTMKTIQASGLLYKIKDGINRTGLSLRDFLRTEEGKNLADQYGYGEAYVDVLSNKFMSVI